MPKQKITNKNNKLPAFFKPLMWSYRFSRLNPEELKDRLIVNTINYGKWRHWQWLVNYYGKKKIKKYYHWSFSQRV